MKKQFKVPFDKNGNQLTYNNLPYRIHEEVDNYEFTGRLYYSGYEGGRSTSIIIWKDHNNKEFRSSMDFLNTVLIDYPELCGISEINNRLFVDGKFTFKKQGTAILLTFAK